MSRVGWQFFASPLSIANVFDARCEASGRAWIFTSATLAVGRDFSLYQSELGLADAATGCWESPFDYATQALLYVPCALPPPNSREHTAAVVAAALPVLRASGGRAFLLFTTHRALNHARACSRIASPGRASTGRCWCRAKGRAASCLARFRELGNAVLLGSQSFWEGVDVRAMRCRWW